MVRDQQELSRPISTCAFLLCASVFIYRALSLSRFLDCPRSDLLMIVLVDNPGRPRWIFLLSLPRERTFIFPRKVRFCDIPLAPERVLLKGKQICETDLIVTSVPGADGPLQLPLLRGRDRTEECRWLARNRILVRR